MVRLYALGYGLRSFEGNRNENRDPLAEAGAPRAMDIIALALLMLSWAPPLQNV